MIRLNIFNNIDELKNFVKYKMFDIHFENLLKNVRNFILQFFHNVNRFMIDFYQLIEQKLSINHLKLKNDR